MLLEGIIFSLTEVKNQGKDACKLESRLKSKMKPQAAQVHVTRERVIINN